MGVLFCEAGTLKWLEFRLTDEIHVLEHLRKREYCVSQEAQNIILSHLLDDVAFTFIYVSNGCIDFHLEWILVDKMVTFPYSC